MKCDECGTVMKEVQVGVFGTKKKVKSWQCPNCNVFRFDKKTAKKVIESLEEES